MRTEEFHAKKESQLKKLNVAIQTVLRNPFHDETKKRVLAAGNHAAEHILGHRRGVYAILEKFDDFKEDYKHSDSKWAVEVPTSFEPERLHHTVLQNVSDIIGEVKEETIDIVNVATNQKLPVVAKKGFDGTGEEIVLACEDIIAAIHADEILRNPPPKEAPPVPPTPPVDPNVDIVEDKTPEPKKIMHKLTQADFDANPDLNNKGYNIDDEIEIDAESLVEGVLSEKSTDVNGTDKHPDEKPQPPSVTPIEEIQKQNETEVKGPRKNSGKK